MAITKQITRFSVLKTTFGIFPTAGGFTFQQFGLSNSDYMTPGDFDGDGKGDIAVWRDSDGVWYWLNSADSTFQAVQFGTAGDEPIARDYDGDGKTDHAIVRRSNGSMIWYILRSSDLGFSSAPFGLSTDFTAPGDYDGDGKFDLAIQRPGATAASQATFYVQKSSDSDYIIAQWGLSNDLVVPGDYDGDGKTDFAVVREGALPTDNLVWYILKSSDGGFDFRVFGLTGSDIFTQNDYDGDGKTDVAVWRNTTGQFYITRSTDFGVTQAQWGQAGDFPGSELRHSLIIGLMFELRLGADWSPTFLFGINYCKISTVGMSNIEHLISKVFREKTVLIVGDLVADQFFRGTISRVSREAPVFILKHENTETVGGGAANAAANVASLGARALVVGIIGDDQNGRDLKASLERRSVDLSGVVEVAGFQTTTKLRVLAGQQYAQRQQVIRIDYENESEIESDTFASLSSKALANLEDADAVIISDYGYGVASQPLVEMITSAAKDASKPVFVDSRHRIRDFQGATGGNSKQGRSRRAPRRFVFGCRL